MNTMNRDPARDTTVEKVSSEYSPRGRLGQKYLVSGTKCSLRLWELEPGEAEPSHRRDYETLGYVISGRAEVEIEGQKLMLRAGDAWLVPRGAEHSYRILERFTALEATTPPAEVHGRDERDPR